MNTQLVSQLDEIKRLHAQLREQAIRDRLTGLFNRGYLEETLTRELVRAERENSQLCALMIDIDRFKSVNDTYGHHTGDAVLRGFGELLKQNVRGNDVACRYGGDEFVILMLGIAIGAAYQRVAQISQMFSDLVFRSGDSTFHATLSIGIASYPAHGTSVDKLLLAADTALYYSKTERNKISEYVPEMRPPSA